MVEGCQDVVLVDEVMTEARALARHDRSGIITEWHLLQALLGDAGVRPQFRNGRCFEKQLEGYGKYKSKPCGAGSCHPKLPVELQEAMDQVIRQRRLDGVMDDYMMSEDMVEALYEAGSDLLRMVMNRFGYRRGGAAGFDEEVAQETDEEFFRRYRVGFMDRQSVSVGCSLAIAG